MAEPQPPTRHRDRRRHDPGRGRRRHLRRSASADPPSAAADAPRRPRRTSTPVTTQPHLLPDRSRAAHPSPASHAARPSPARAAAKAGPAGLPLGYTHDETGAVNAATNYLMWMNSLKIADKAAADAMAASAAADDATREALIESFDALRSGIGDLTADQPEPARGAYAVAELQRRLARSIYIWAPEVTTDSHGPDRPPVGDRRGPAGVGDGDWKLDGGLIAKTGGAAVDPSIPQAIRPPRRSTRSCAARRPIRVRSPIRRTSPGSSTRNAPH